VSYYHLDAIGSVRMITGPSQNEIARYDFLPFGEQPVAGPPSTLKFTGKERDTETQVGGANALDYFGARYYQGQTGRFTSVDPVFTWAENLMDPQRWNRYAYVRNNPLRYVDPDGRTPFNFGAGLVGLGIGATTGFIGSVAADLYAGRSINWKNAGATTVGAGVSGFITGFTLGGSLLAEAGIGTVLAVNAGGEVVGGAVTRKLDDDPTTR